LLNGLAVDAPQLAEVGIKEETPYVAVAALTFRGGDGKESTQYYAASRMLAQTLSNLASCHVIPLDMRHVVVLFFLSTKAHPSEMILRGVGQGSYGDPQYFSWTCKAPWAKRWKDWSAVIFFSPRTANAEKAKDDHPLVYCLDEARTERFDLSPYRERFPGIDRNGWGCVSAPCATDGQGVFG
jgi:hypothetical protein